MWLAQTLVRTHVWPHRTSLWSPHVQRHCLAALSACSHSDPRLNPGCVSAVSRGLGDPLGIPSLSWASPSTSWEPSQSPGGDSVVPSQLRGVSSWERPEDVAGPFLPLSDHRVSPQGEPGEAGDPGLPGEGGPPVSAAGRERGDVAVGTPVMGLCVPLCAPCTRVLYMTLHVHMCLYTTLMYTCVCT